MVLLAIRQTGVQGNESVRVVCLRVCCGRLCVFVWFSLFFVVTVLMHGCVLL